MNRKRILGAIAVPLVALAIAAGAVAAHAGAPSATIKLASQAALASPPNALVVTVTYSCLPSQFAFGEVEVDQHQSSPVASGSGGDVFGFAQFQPTCDDKDHKADVVVTAFGGFFQPGTASASAFVGAGAAFASDQTELTIK